MLIFLCLCLSVSLSLSLSLSGCVRACVCMCVCIYVCVRVCGVGRVSEWMKGAFQGAFQGIRYYIAQRPVFEINGAERSLVFSSYHHVLVLQYAL